MAHNNLGNVYAEKGKHAAAIAEFQRGLRIAPASSFLYNGLANSFSAAGKGKQALRAFQSALAVPPDAHYATYNLGNCLRGLERPPEAEFHIRKALRAAPREARYAVGLGQLLHEQKHWRGPRLDEAVGSYRYAIQLLERAGSPRSPPVERDLAAALRDAKR